MTGEGQECGGEGVGTSTEVMGRSHGSGRRREEGLACQKGRSHEEHGVEGDYGQRRVSPRRLQPAYQAWRYMTTDGQEDARGLGIPV